MIELTFSDAGDVVRKISISGHVFFDLYAGIQSRLQNVPLIVMVI